jgi:hypothetical protein
MEIKTIQLDRSRLSSEFIASRQNFKQIVKCCEAPSISPFKSPLFFGAMGLSSLSLIVFLNLNDHPQASKENSKNKGVEMR